jgi:hypothetical protein
VQQRITRTTAADGSVRQLRESSSDEGRTWTVLFDGGDVRAPQRGARVAPYHQHARVPARAADSSFGPCRGQPC